MKFSEIVVELECASLRLERGTHVVNVVKVQKMNSIRLTATASPVPAASSSTFNRLLPSQNDANVLVQALPPGEVGHQKPFQTELFSEIRIFQTISKVLIGDLQSAP